MKTSVQSQSPAWYSFGGQQSLLSTHLQTWEAVGVSERLSVLPINKRARDQNGDKGSGSIEVHCVKMSSSCKKSQEESCWKVGPTYVLYIQMTVFVQHDPISNVWHASTCYLRYN